MARDYHLTQTGEETQEAINKILALDIATTDTPGLMSGEDKAILDALPSEVSDKANRASGATNGHLASLDASGDLVDSGKSVYDFATKEQGTLADSAYQKPENGIPASDMAPGVIPDVSDVVRTSVQSLSDGDKSQARENIGAASEGALEGKVDKVEGKGLSTNDYTDEDKSRVSYLPTALAGLGDAIRAKYTKPSTGIPASDIEDGVIPDVSNFITKSVDDLVNYYLKSETYTKDEVAALIGAIQQFHYEIYASRQDVVSPANNVLYLIGPTGSGADKYEEYVYDSTKQEPWVKIGDTSIDLSGYVTTQALNTALAAYTTTNDLATLLAGKQDIIDANHKLAYSLLSGTPPEIFPVTYGTTTQSQIASAVAANKIPVCKYGDNVYVYAGESSAGYSQFTSILYNTAARIYVKDSTWGNGNFEIYSKPSGGIPKSDLASGVQSSLAKADTALQEHQDISGKADKVSGATSGDFAGLDSNGNLTDSGSKASDFATAAQGAKADSAYQVPQGGIPASDLADKYAGSPSAGGPAFKALGIPFGNVDANSTATDIKATVDNFPATLVAGVCAYIRNDVIASASGFTLNVNGTGALPVYQTLSDASRSTTVFSAAVTYLFIYNPTRVEGGCWDIYYGYNANDNTIGYILRTNYMSMPVTSACYRYRLLFTSANGQSFVPANASSSTNATAARTTTQTPIDPFGSIRYYDYTTAVTSGNRPDATYLCEQYQVTLGYSFNRTGAALTLTSWDPVYIKCAPQSDGSAIIDADTPYVQALPSTEDGKIYIFLGVATSATQVEVVFHHPVYYYKDGAIRPWTNAAAVGATSLSDLSDVSTQAPTQGKILGYDGTTQLWTPIGLATTLVPNVTSVGSASTWSFSVNEHTITISGGNGSTPTLGLAKTVATGDFAPTQAPTQDL